MIEHVDVAREQQSRERHVANILSYPVRQARQRYIEQMRQDYAPEFVASVEAEVKQRWERR